MRRGYLFTSWFMILAISCCLWACFEEEDYNFDKISSIEWDPSYAIPIVHGNLSVDDLIGDLDLLELRTYPDGLYYLYFETETESDALQSLVELPPVEGLSRSYNSQVNFAGSLSEDTTIVDVIFNVDIPLETANLDSVFYDNMDFIVDFASNVQGNLSIEFVFPTFRDENDEQISVSFDLSSQVPPSSSLDNTFSFSGILADLTKAAPDPYNAFPIRLIVKLEAGDVIVTTGNTFSLNLDLRNQDFGYVKGYILPQSRLITDEDINIELFKNKFTDADVNLQGTKMDFIIDHSFGVPLRLYFNTLQATNDEGTSLPLEIIPETPVDIDYPETFGQVEDDTITVTNSAEIFDFEPVSFQYQIDAFANEDDIPGEHFLIDTSKARLKFIAEIPLWGNASGLTLQDTFKLDLQSVDEDGIEIDADSAILKTKIENGYPLEALVQAYILDENYRVLDSIFTREQQKLIVGAATSESGIDSNGVFDDEIKIGKAKLDNLLEAKHMYLIARLRTARNNNTVPDVRFFEQGTIDVKMGLRTDLNVKVKP